MGKLMFVGSVIAFGRKRQKPVICLRHPLNWEVKLGLERNGFHFPLTVKRWKNQCLVTCNTKRKRARTMTLYIIWNQLGRLTVSNKRFGENQLVLWGYDTNFFFHSSLDGVILVYEGKGNTITPFNRNRIEFLICQMNEIIIACRNDAIPITIHTCGIRWRRRR